MKRITGFVLIFCMLLALCLPASAEAAQEPFRDLSEIEHRSEVSLLVALGLISGYADQTFRPTATITRAETAKLIALLCEEAPGGGDGWFADLEGCWATDYILYCARRGIIAGDGNGLFRPQASVTGRELAKMLLVVTGCDPARYSGADWAAAVDADAAAYGIYAWFNQDPSAPISRDNACLLIYNAMQCLAIAGYDADGQPVYTTDELMNPVTFLEQQFGVVRYTSILTGNAYADLTGDGTLAQGLSKLAGHKAFAVTTDLSLVGRWVDVYVRDGQVISTPCASTSVTSYTFTSWSELSQLCLLTGYCLDEDAAYYYNYSVSSRQVLEQLSGPAEITVLDQDGDLAFEQIVMVSFVSGVVEQDAPLQVRVAGSTVSAIAYQSGDVFEAGQTVQCVQVNGLWFVK